MTTYNRNTPCELKINSDCPNLSEIILESILASYERLENFIFEF